MNAGVFSRQIFRATRRLFRPQRDTLVVEEPLEIHLGDRSLTVLMRTPGNDEELTAGFLFTEELIQARTDLLELRHCADKNGQIGNVLSVALASHVVSEKRRAVRSFFSSSACGVCGKTTLEALRVTSEPIRSRMRVPLTLLYSLYSKLQAGQSVFRQTGALHAAALFDSSGKMLLVREDVGRHNAVDKIVGAALLDKQLPLDKHILVVSGRAGYEIVQKALRARIPIVTAVGGPSSLAVDLADEFGLTLVGFLRGRRCNVYTHKQRLIN